MKRHLAIASILLFVLSTSTAFARGPLQGRSHHRPRAASLSRVVQYPVAIFAALQGNFLPIASLLADDGNENGDIQNGEKEGANNDGTNDNGAIGEHDDGNSGDGPNGDGSH
jgi:hypothetical protein